MTPMQKHSPIKAFIMGIVTGAHLRAKGESGFLSLSCSAYRLVSVTSRAHMSASHSILKLCFGCYSLGKFLWDYHHLEMVSFVFDRNSQTSICYRTLQSHPRLNPRQGNHKATDRHSHLLVQIKHCSYSDQNDQQFLRSHCHKQFTT